jgi:divalent metal cation (Fe/Co/Zn/Cd) transporter
MAPKHMRAVRRMAMLSSATLLMTLGLKFGAYLLTGSLGLWSDAMEALVNLVAGTVALGALPIASRPYCPNTQSRTFKQ